MSVPTATYRLQLRRELTFADAAAIVPYLAELGVSHVYCSPILQAVPGSEHGYDVLDHSRLSDDLGGDAGWQQLVDACHRNGLGIVVDIVPNHMAIPDPPTLNWQWADVLEHGRESRFAHWFDIDWDESERTGHLIYRRFFDVGSLVGVRVEEPDVFEATHARILAAVRAAEIDGLRIDHPDGLADPRGYLDRLATATDGIWTVAEKILEPGEDLPHDWKCAGTTGYDAIAAVTHVLLDSRARERMTDIYADLGGERDDFHVVVDESKRYVLQHVLAPEVDRLVRELAPAAPADLDVDSLGGGIVEMLVAFDVYRAYPDEPASARHIDDAAARAAKRAPSYGTAIGWLAGILHEGYVRFEQTTGPVMAKGVEDTAFYRYLRLTALNEVGGDPGAFGLSVVQWHADCVRRAVDWPRAMTTLTTHDTKRTEDVRARLLVLSELPTEWSAAVKRWRERSAQHGLLDENTDYLFWQTLVGAWPLTVERMTAYLEKATREAKTHTSWIDPDESYDASVRHFAHAVFADEQLLTDVRDWCERHIDEPGRANALSQKLLQLTMPGIPDVYQGQELTAPALVDPDNRRPVDYDARRRQLATLHTGGTGDGGTAVDPKLLVTARTLQLRRDRPGSFNGPYTPLAVTGERSDHAIACLRDTDVAAVVTRLPAGLARAGGFGDARVTLPPGVWTDVFTDARHEGTIALVELTDTYPVALLRRETG